MILLQYQNKKNFFPWTYVISDLKGEEIVGTCYKKNYKK